MRPAPTIGSIVASRTSDREDSEIVTPVAEVESPALYQAEEDADRSRSAAKGLGQYVPLLAWTMVVITLLFIPLKIISYGFLAPGDARRHVAKAFTDKPYTDIIVMRPEYKMDHSPGWEWALGSLRGITGWGSDQLMAFSIVSMMLCVFLAPLPWLRRPEAWLAALLAQLVAIPELMTRFVQARPYLLTEGILIAILFAWSAKDDPKPSRPKIVLTTLGIALSVWVHGAWYLWVLPVAAFLLARKWRQGLWLAGCILVGTVAGALLTGHPVEFLNQALLIAASISKEHVPQWLLVGEFRPSYGEFTTALLVAVVLIWRRLSRNTGFHSAVSQTSSLLPSRQIYTPAFWLIILCWILGFKADRFWADWGLPAVLVWLTLQFQEGLAETWDAISPRRLLAGGLIALPLFLHSTNDLDRRYTGTLNESFLDASQPALQDWVPEANGIFYSAHMDFFYNTFYKNPQGQWRYILGMEPALMPDADLHIFRDIQLSQYSFKAYEPWIGKMTPADRLAIRCSGQPPLSQLDWTNAAGDLWIGRLPRAK